MTRNDTIRLIVREWTEKNTYLPVHSVDEDSDVDGNRLNHRTALCKRNKAQFTACTLLDFPINSVFVQAKVEDFQ
ncbi:hypothetical protein [Rhizobium leguminosarum]